jgi:cell division protein FtsB
MKSLWGHGSRYLRVRRSVEVSPRLARAILIAVLTLVALIFVAGDVGLWRLWRAQAELSRLKERIADLEARNSVLSAEIERLRTDPFSIEKVAREKYGYIRPGDHVYRIVVPTEDLERASKTPTALDRKARNP